MKKLLVITNHSYMLYRFRKELIEQYGQERGSKIRYAEAYEVCEYGSPMPEEMKQELLSLA